MKTLGFGLRSLLKDPQWAQSHNINPYNQTAGSVVGDNKESRIQQNKAKNGDVDAASNINNIFVNQNKINAINTDNSIFSQAKIGAAGGQKSNIFEMMNKFDENHKTLMGAQAVQPTAQIDPQNSIDSDEITKKLGKRLNLMM